MRTNIEIDDALMAEALQRSGLPTKKQVVEEALKAFIRFNQQAQGRELFGALKWDGDLDDMRTSKHASDKRDRKT